MKKTLKAFRKKLLESSPAIYILIIVCSILFILLSISSLSKNIAMDNLIDNSESNVVAFDHYHIARDVTDGSVLNIKIYLENGDSIEIDSYDYSKELEISLQTKNRRRSLLCLKPGKRICNTAHK